MSIRLTIYHKGNAKPIVLTDDSETDIQELKGSIEAVFTQKNIFKLETDKDCLIGRPSELQAVLISGNNENRERGASVDSPVEETPSLPVPEAPSESEPKTEVSSETEVPTEEPPPVEIPLANVSKAKEVEDLDAAVREAEKINAVESDKK